MNEAAPSGTTLSSRLREYLKNRWVRRLLRLILIAAAAWLFFSRVCRPMILSGRSMMPAFPERGLVFCWYPAYWFSAPKRGDAAVFFVGGDRMAVLKRILAFEGEIVECRSGDYYINGEKLSESYVKYRSPDWTIRPFRVAEGCVYIMGDNRSMPLGEHKGGETAIRRLAGKPLLIWSW